MTYTSDLGRWNPEQDDFSNVFCAGYMLSELVAMETKTQIAGVTNIADASGSSPRSSIKIYGTQILRRKKLLDA